MTDAEMKDGKKGEVESNDKTKKGKRKSWSTFLLILLSFFYFLTTLLLDEIV